MKNKDLIKSILILIGFLVVAGIALRIIGGIFGLVRGVINAVLGIAVVIALIVIVIWMFSYAKKQ